MKRNRRKTISAEGACVGVGTSRTSSLAFHKAAVTTIVVEGFCDQM